MSECQYSFLVLVKFKVSHGWLVLHFVCVGEIAGVALLVKFKVSPGLAQRWAKFCNVGRWGGVGSLGALSWWLGGVGNLLSYR